MITLSPEQISSILSDAKAEAVAIIISQHKDDSGFITPAQAGGILNVTQNTLLKLKIPRYPLVVGSVVQYKLSEVLAYRESTRESA